MYFHPYLKVFGDKDSQDLVEVLGVVPVDGAGVVARLMPDRGERRHDKVEDGNSWWKRLS